MNLAWLVVVFTAPAQVLALGAVPHAWLAVEAGGLTVSAAVGVVVWLTRRRVP